MIDQREISEAVRKLEGYYLRIDKDIKPMLAYAAAPLVNSAKTLAPVGSRVHKRYKKASRRSAKGSGRVLARYNPGNLRASIQVLEKLKRVKRAVLVGPNVTRGGGTFGGARTDGYYAHFIEFGTAKMRGRAFMRPAFQSAKSAILNRLELKLKSITK